MKTNRNLRLCLIALLLAAGSAVNAQQSDREITTSATPDSIAYLGVATESIDRIVAKQLKITPGQGLVVLHIDTNSAAAASLHEYDIILKLGDQMLVNQPQLATLVAAKQPGDEISLEVMRAGKRQLVKVVLGERELEDILPKIDLRSPHIETFVVGPDGPMDVDSMQKALHELFSRTGSRAASMTNIQATTVDVDVRGLGGGTSQSIRFGSSAMTMTLIDGDADASATLSESDGEQHLLIKDLDDNVIYDKPVTDDTRDELPAKYRDIFDRLLRMRSNTQIKAGTGLPTFTRDGIPL
jgi:hypothetical protein